jgi:hypothetical protein
VVDAESRNLSVFYAESRNLSVFFAESRNLSAKSQKTFCIIRHVIRHFSDTPYLMEKISKKIFITSSQPLLFAREFCLRRAPGRAENLPFSRTVQTLGRQTY